jgi:hypothetical protein
MTRRNFLASSAVLAAPAVAAPRKWPLGLNTYCLRFQRWNDRQLMDYCVSQKLAACFLQDSIDPGRMDAKHWAEVRDSAEDHGRNSRDGRDAA